MTELRLPIPSSRASLVRRLLPALLLPGMAAAQAAEVGVSGVQPLAFGSFTAGKGTLSISPAGVRTTSGQVVALSADPGQPARFVVTGDPGMVYAITLPADGTVTLSDGTAHMPLNGFVSDPSGSGVLPGSGSQVLSVGATLEITDDHRPGSYSGSFSVTVNYN